MTRQQITLAYLFDHPDCVDVCASWAFGQWGSQRGGTLTRAQKKFAASTDRNSLPLTMLALAESKPAGMISLWETDLPGRGDLSPWLASLFVHPFYRGQGLAGLLARRIETEAVRLGFSALYLVTETEAAFYEKIGWSPFEAVKTELGNAYLMKKQLV